MSFKHYRATPLIISIIVLATAIDWAFLQIAPYLHDHIVRAPSNTAIIALLLTVYDKWLWKLPILKWIVTVPDLNGRYRGSLSSSYNGKSVKKDCVIEIFQTASKTTIYLFSSNDQKERSYSKSVSEVIHEEEDNEHQIFFAYYNYGSDDKKLSGHEGFNHLKITGKKSNVIKLQGQYFTNREPQTRGEIRVKFESKKRKERF
jgi:hypothetical protein